MDLSYLITTVNAKSKLKNWQIQKKKLTEIACFVYTLLDLIYLVVNKQCNACQGTLLGLEVIVLFKTNSWLKFKVGRSNLLNNHMQSKL